MREIIVKKNDAGQRLDRFVGKAVPLLPESLIQKYIRTKYIKLNGKRAQRDDRVQEGDVLQFYIRDEFFEKPQEQNSYLKVGNPRLTVVYEDENIIILNKPVGLMVHDGENKGEETLISELLEENKWIRNISSIALNI